MKKYILPALFILSTLSCDDGDILVKNIDFESINIVKCPSKDVLYKIKDSEMLFLEIPSSDFPIDATNENTPKEIEVSATKRLVYRQYDATISADNICPNVPDATQNLKEEWITTSGTITIVTTANVVPNNDIDSPNATKIATYNHAITVKNGVWQKPDGNYAFTDYTFGNYTTTPTALPFNFDDQVDKSTCGDNRIFNFSGSEAFILDFADYATLFENVTTTSPRTALISATNKVTYSLYNGIVNDNYFCTNLTSPTLNQSWSAVAGVDGVSGIIEVETTSAGPNSFLHTIHLKKVVLKRGNSDFTLGDDYVYGSFITNN